MDDLSKYVFYVIVNDGDMGYSYGVTKGNRLEHQSYLKTLIGIEPYFFDNVDISYCWSETIENFTKSGNIVIVSSTLFEQQINSYFRPSFA